MVSLRKLLPSLLAFCHVASCLASAWHFTDGSVSVQGKKAGAEGGFKDKLVEHKPLAKPITLGPSDSLKVVVTIQEGKNTKRPHQAFLLLKDADTGLDIAYPFSVKQSGKAKVDLTHKELPIQFLRAAKTIEGHIVIGSFGPSKGYNERAFSLNIATDSNVPLPTSQKPLRYGKLPEIHHTFKPDPRSPNILFSLVFTAAVLATLPAIFGVWLYLGGNVNHLPKAFQSAPLSHTLFYGSIISIEGIFLLYYASWNLPKTLPVLLAVGTIAFLSGSRALSEVQERRLAGLR